MSKKFSQFVEGDIPKTTDIIVGLRAGDNTQFDFSGINDPYDHPIVSYEYYNEFARNYIRFLNSPMGVPVVIQAQGIDADVGLALSSKANGNLTLTSPNAGNVNIVIGGAGDINMSTNAGRIYLNATDPLYGFTTDSTFSGASDEYAPSALAVKTYVDSHIATSNFFISTLVASTGNLSATYDNGASGVGATLTATSNGAAVIDGVSLSLGDIVLFKDQSSALQNGVYTVIQVGDAGTPSIYERYIYFDDTAEIKQGYTTFTVEGATNAKKGYQVTSVTNTIGVDAINYQQLTIPSITSSTDNAIVRFDGTSGGQIQNSGVTVSDLDVLDGATQINVDNLRLDGNILSSTNINGDVTIDPSGTGAINLNSPAVIIGTALQHAGDTNNQLVFGTDVQDFQTSGSSRLDLSDLGVRMGGTGARITSISDDTTMAADSSTLGVTQHAAKTYADSVGGGAVTLTNAGTTSLVNDGTGPTLATKGLVAGTAISFSTSATDVTVTNTAPDQTVVLTSGTGISVTGTYPNFTITNTDTGASVTLSSAGGTETLVNDGIGPTLATKGLSAGTGVSLSSDAVSVTVTNSAPDQTVSITNSNGLTVGGTYPNFTIGITAPVSIANGGTNTTSAIGATGTIAQSDGTKYTFTTATYPSTAASAGTFMRADGTNWTASTATLPNTAGTSGTLLQSNGTGFTNTTATYPGTAGTSGTILRSNGTNIVNSTPTFPNTAASGKLMRGDGTNWVESTTTFADTYSASVLLYSNGANTVTGLATANSAVLVTSSAGVPAWSSTMTNGQLIIGSTSGTPTAATLTAGSGISITNAAGSITIASTGSGSWTEVTGTSQSMAVNSNYIANNAGLVTLTLPTTAAIGDFVMVDGKGAGLYKIAQNASQVIHTGTTDTTTGTGGSLTATNRYDCIRLRCITANTDWVIEGLKGAFTIA